MATITGLTAARMLAIEAASVVDGDVVGDDLILTRQDGSQINAGSVRGDEGPAGPAGSDLTVVTARSILEVGILNQIRAGRQLTATDFTNMGLAAPIGLWNLSNLTDSSGNGRNLTNKGTVPFVSGINGVAASAAQFAGSAAQALYIADSGASDPFRLRAGSVGAWFRTARTGVYQAIIGKYGQTDGTCCYWLQIANNNVVHFNMSPDGTFANQFSALGISDVVDDRWHFAVATCDGAMVRLYVDGVQEGFLNIPGLIHPGAAPFTIGALSANASTASLNSHLGRIDEAFVTADVLSEDQIRNLYCAKISHTFGSVPKRAGLTVRRRKKGAALTAGDFPTQPLRLYNFSAGSLGDQGSNGQTLTNSGGAVSAPGVDGSLGNAFALLTGSAQQLISTDTGLPTGTNPRSYGLWFKQSGVQNSAAVVSWGGAAGSANTALWINGAGQLVARSGVSDDMAGPFVSDGEWHFAVVTEENAPLDGGKRKLYVDGHYQVGSVNLNAITLGGANRFRIGHWPDGSGGGLPSFNGLVDSVFVCGYVLDAKDIIALYIKGAQALGVSPKNEGDHIEAMSSTDLLCLFDSLPAQHQVDLAVA